MVGEDLVKKGIITPQQLNTALEYKKKYPNKKILDLLYDLKFISKDTFLKELSKELEVPYVENIGSVRLFDISNIPVNILNQARAVPIEIKYDKVKIAMEDPLNWNAQAYFKRLFPDKKVEFVLAHKEDIDKVLKLLMTKYQVSQIIRDIKKELRGQDVAGEQSAIMRLILFIIKSAIEKNASDIHIEAEENGAIVRIRIYGTLYELLDFDMDVFNAISSRIKLEAGMDVSEKRKPQDGAFSLEMAKNKFDFRVSTLPTVWGESIVIRILDKRNILKKLDDIGISEKNLHLLKKALSYPNGIFLVTGPTGSGKSTTLYASINELVGVDTKLITVEDPVEYKLKGIQQVQVNPKAGFTFADALRSILRQDPDKIMIGEIRDLETLEIAIKASLTGHLVLSTLHTNDSVSAISRMIDMGAEPYMVAASLIGVEAQRLVKKNCPYCKVEYRPSDAYLEPVKAFLKPDTKFYKGKGCDKCNMTGFIGRTLISEIFIKDEHLESMIAKNKEKTEIMDYLSSKGFRGMFYDGLALAMSGVTPLEEIYKVAKP